MASAYSTRISLHQLPPTAMTVIGNFLTSDPQGSLLIHMQYLLLASELKSLVKHKQFTAQQTSTNTVHLSPADNMILSLATQLKLTLISLANDSTHWPFTETNHARLRTASAILEARQQAATLDTHRPANIQPLQYANLLLPLLTLDTNATAVPACFHANCLIQSVCEIIIAACEAHLDLSPFTTRLNTQVLRLYIDIRNNTHASWAPLWNLRNISTRIYSAIKFTIQDAVSMAVHKNGLYQSPQHSHKLLPTTSTLSERYTRCHPPTHTLFASLHRCTIPTNIDASETPLQPHHLYTDRTTQLPHLPEAAIFTIATFLDYAHPVILNSFCLLYTSPSPRD